MALYIATIIYVILKGLLGVTNGNELPTRCSGSTSITCYPVIPSYVQLYGWNLTNVKDLNLFHGYGLRWSLKTLPSGLFNWANNIEYIYMSNVGLENLKCDIFQPLKNSLNTLHMDYNLFREFPSCSLKNLNQLQAIDFSRQNIESVNINDLELNALRYINLDRNQISNFSISNINSKTIMQFVLNNNKISYLNISGINRFSYFHVKENRLTEINHDIFQYSHTTLVDLELSYNALDDDIWNVLKGVTSLRTLKLKQNRIQTVSPSVINRLSKLYHLDLSHNHISALTDVLLRSGKMSDILLNSNKFENFPPNLIHDTNTFRNNSDCTLDISNNMIVNIQLNMRTTSSRLTLNLGQNKLTAIYFYTNDNEIESLNISSNRLVTLPGTLPKARRYIISNNPLDTKNVLKHLTTTMKDATCIEMDDIDFFCKTSEHYDFTNVPLPNIITLSLRQNCIPITFLCNIGKSKVDIHVDYNKNHYDFTEDIPCKMHTKEFGVVSLSGYRISNLGVALFMSKYTNTISNVTSLYLNKSQIRELPFIRYVSLSNHGIHVFDFSGNFLKTFYGLELITVSESFTLNLEYNQIIEFGKVTLNTNEGGYSKHINLKYTHNYIAIVNDSHTLIEIVGRFIGSFDVSIDLSFNRLHVFDLASVVNYNNDGFYFMLWNLNVSHNDLEVYLGCPPTVGHTSIQMLDYTYNKFRELPENSCHYATETYLGHNSIMDISRTLPTTSMTKLDLEWNLIQYINDNAFTNITSLKILNLRGNNLKIFPYALQKLRQLTTLDISYNKIINIKQSYIDGKMKSLASLILTGNDLAPHLSTPIGFSSYTPGLGLKDNLIHCDCDVLFLRNNTLNTQGRCSFPTEFEGYLVSCFPVDNCVENGQIYVYRKTKSRCLNDDYFDIKISILEVDEILSVGWTRLGPKKQRGVKLIAYSEQIIVKVIEVNETGQTNSFFVPHSLNANRLCIHAYLNDRTFERCVYINHTEINGKSNSVSETNSNNGAIYGTSAALVLSVLLNIFGSIFIFVNIRKKWPTNDANSNQFANTAYVPNEYEMSSSRQGRNNQQLDVYDQLSENSNNNTDGGAYENLNI